MERENETAGVSDVGVRRFTVEQACMCHAGPWREGQRCFCGLN